MVLLLHKHVSGYILWQWLPLTVLLICLGTSAAVYIPEIVINPFEARFELFFSIVQPLQ